MEIIIELTLTINFIINCFIIKSTALFFKEKPRLCWLSSLLGSVIALLLPLCNAGKFVLLIQVFLAALMITISFKFKTFKRFLALYAGFYIMTFIFGGGCYAVQQAIGQFPLFCVLGIVFSIYMIISAVFRYRNKLRTIENFSYQVRLYSKGIEVQEEGYLDSGNVLYDPITKKPIILINFDVFSKLYSNINYLTAYMKNIDCDKITNGHYIKFNTIASGTSILVFTVDRIEIEREQTLRTYNDVAVGLTFSGFERALGKKILLHSQFI